MNETRLKTLVYLLIGIETAIVVSSYYEYIGFISICIGGIYTITALSDFWSKENIQITRLLLLLSILITIPRFVIQTEEVINKEKTKELAILDTLPRPTKREVKLDLLDCSRIPQWQGELQINCNQNNLSQRREENRVEEAYIEEMRVYEKEIHERKKAIQNSNLRFLNLKSVSIIFLYLLVTPIIPLLILFLVHDDRKYMVEVISPPPIESIERNPDIQEIHKNRKIMAKKLLVSGFKMEEIQCEVGVSRATLYRWRKEIEVNGLNLT